MKKQRNIVYPLLFGLLMTVLFLPALQEHLGLVKTEPLEGFVPKAKMPQLTLESYTSNECQKQLEGYVGEHFGFREPVIRLYNQYLWTCFRKTYCHFIMPGKDGYLFYSEAVNDYYGLETLKVFKTYDQARERARKNVRMMNKLRGVLQDYGVEFLCFMAPNKTRLYSEHLPLHKTVPPDAINTADYYDSLMTAIGFPHVEMTRWYQQIKDTASFQLIPKRDSHWRYAAAYGFDSLFSYMDHLNGFGIPDIRVLGMRPLDTSYRENDEKTLNLIFKIPNDAPKYKPEVVVECGEGCRKPKVLFVGDSFVWDLETYLPWKEILDDVEIWFYNENAFVGFEKEKHPIGEIDRLQSILRADYVVWYSSGSQWCRSSYGFVEDALVRLCVSDSLFNAQIPWVMDSLRNNGVSADSLRSRAIRILKNDPELIPGLRGEDIPTVRNTKAIQKVQLANTIDSDKPWQTALRVFASQNNRPYQEVLQQEVENYASGLPLLRDAVVVDTASIIRLEVEKLMDQWRNNPESVQFLEEKAKQKGKTFETVLQEDAQWVVNERLRNGELF